MKTTTVSVDVDVTPDTAFTVFTEEMDLWHVRSPISFYDSARAIARRCEPGVGGRIVEVYQDGEFEIARITCWEPGRQVSWKDTQDDVVVDVFFESRAQGGCTVRIVAGVPDGGADRGGTSIVRVGPEWLSQWIARRQTAPREIVELPRLNLELHYARPVAAMRWLAAAFGFPLPSGLPADESGGIPSWIETRAGGAALMLFELDGQRQGPSALVPFVYVDDLDAHFERARAHGARIVQDIHQHGYRRYVCEDLERNRWSFAQARPTMR